MYVSTPKDNLGNVRQSNILMILVVVGLLEMITYGRLITVNIKRTEFQYNRFIEIFYVLFWHYCLDIIAVFSHLELGVFILKDFFLFEYVEVHQFFILFFCVLWVLEYEDSMTVIETTKVWLTMLIDDTGPMLFTNMSTSMTVGFTEVKKEKKQRLVKACSVTWFLSRTK